MSVHCWHSRSNADALLNLPDWARTGEETPMYSSAHQRDADIEAGACRPAPELRAWVAWDVTGTDEPTPVTGTLAGMAAYLSAARRTV